MSLRGDCSLGELSNHSDGLVTFRGSRLLDTGYREFVVFNYDREFPVTVQRLDNEGEKVGEPLTLDAATESSIPSLTLEAGRIVSIQGEYVGVERVRLTPPPEPTPAKNTRRKAKPAAEPADEEPRPAPGIGEMGRQSLAPGDIDHR